jgi:hypothetical protein
MNSKSGFLANRMVNFVYKDYDLLIKNSVDFSPFQKELFESQGMAAFDRMLLLYNGNPANIQSDLNMALRINTGNLDALEMLLKDSMTGTIAELKMVSEGGSSSSSSVFFNSIKRMYKDINKDAIMMRKRSLLNPLGWFSIIAANGEAPLYWYNHSDRYPLTGKDVSSTPQSEFNDAGAVQAQLCIQALAFNDQNAIQDVCSGTVLKSPLDGIVDNDFAYDKLLKVDLNNTSLSVQMRRSMNHSDRVCAFRNYNRKTMVRYMGINKEQN